MKIANSWSVRSVAAALALSLSFAARAEDACLVDLDGDGTVQASDLAILIGGWGSCEGCEADVNRSGSVDAEDLALLLGLWGATCSPLGWATVLEFEPDAAVVTDSTLREAIGATGLPWRVRDNASQVEMLLVPPGTFDMGCSPSMQWDCLAGESPVHAVTLSSPFYIGRYEVTQAQWTAQMGANPSYFVEANGYPGSTDRPVERVSWTMIQGFLAATGLRLPTEAEWEYAYRAGTTTAFHSAPGFPNGTDSDRLVESIAWYSTGSCSTGALCQTHVVGGKEANALGLHDMSGNVWEWVNDWYSSTYYASSPPTDPPGPATGTFRVLRGGSWYGNSFNVRSSRRNVTTPDDVSDRHGFRVARLP